MVEIKGLRSRDMLTETQVSEIFGIARATLRCWRYAKRGPRYYKAGATVRYKIEDVDAYLIGRPVETVDSVRAEQES